MKTFRDYITEERFGPVYHGTDKSFGKFKTGTPSSSGVKSSGIFFTKSAEVASGFGNNVISAYLNMEDYITFDFQKRSTIRFDGKSRTPSELTNRISEINDDLKKNYGLPDESESDLVFELADAGWEESFGLDYIDGIIMKNVDDSMTIFGGKITDHYIVFSSKQIKNIKAVKERK